MKPLLASVILASVSPAAIAQHGLQAETPDQTSEMTSNEMAGDAVQAELPGAIEKAVINDWFETEFDREIHSSVIKAARRAYTQTMFEPIWTEDGAQALQDTASDLFSYGLVANTILEADLQKLVDERFSADTPDASAEADLALSAAWLRIASAVSGGLGDEGEAETSKRSAATYALITEKLIEAGKSSVGISFDPFETDYPQYDRLKSALSHYRDLRDKGGWSTISEGDTIEPGDSDPRVPAVRKRLAAEGYIDRGQASDSLAQKTSSDAAIDTALFTETSGSDAENAAAATDPSATSDDTQENVFTEDLVSALKSFQRRHGIKEDGLVGPNTLEALNESVESKIARVADSMERWRQQGSAEDRYVWVNIPSYSAQGWKDGDLEIQSKAIVGTAEHETPTFNDQIEYVVANPKWYMPVSILRNEKVPQLKEDPGYAQRANFKVIDRSSGQEVSAYSVNWNDPDVATQYRLVQQPGSNNALGELKIIFPNQYSVYLHGTPGEHLFDRANRAFSHGCVRLEKPTEMAEWLASIGDEVDPDTLEQTVEDKTHERFDLERKIPVHVTYMTVTVDEDGKAHFWRDIYDRTEGMAQVEKYASVNRSEVGPASSNDRKG